MRLIDADEVNKTIDRFIGYLDEDMILRIKWKISEIPTVAEEITGFATSRITNDMVERFGKDILNRVTQEVVQHIGASLYQKGAITIEKVEDRATQEMVLIGRVSVLKKEDNQHGEHQG